MKKIICQSRELHAEYEIVSKEENKNGLILHSRSEKKNAEYSQALECILGKLQQMGMMKIDIFVVSSELKKEYTQFERQIFIEDQPIYLNTDNIEQLRIEIGREVAKLKVNKESKGGTSSKRILLHHPDISENIWSEIAQDIMSVDAVNSMKNTSTHDLIEKDLSQKPHGNKKPTQRVSVVYTYDRDIEVVHWILENANGVCELCQKAAPFDTVKGKKYLEVHHLIPLSKNGEDTIKNTIAVCPNCHKALHYAKNKEELLKSIVLKNREN